MDEYHFRLDNVKLDPLDFLEETGNMDLQVLQDVMVMDGMASLGCLVEMAKKVKKETVQLEFRGL